MAKKVKAMCAVAECGKEFDTRESDPKEECPDCRSSFYYWKKKRPAEIVHRRAHLKLFGSRLDQRYNEEGKKR